MASKQYARRFFMSELLDEDFREYKEATWAIIDEYCEKYQTEIEWEFQDVKQRYIRMWLHYKNEWQERGGTISEDLHKYVIKSTLKVIPVREEYEDAVEAILRFETERSLKDILALGLFTMPAHEMA